MVARIARIALGVVVVAFASLYGVGAGCFGQHEAPGTIEGAGLPPAVVAARARPDSDSAQTLGVVQPKQILFGDLHVHTTFSADAFLRSLPIVNGEGSHPPADACDFARFCSALDFWSINDHAEGLTPRHWRETVDSIRQCNAIAGDPANPDMVAYLGWEWTNVGLVPETHYGHKNVVIRDLDDAHIPKRPIASRGATNAAMAGPGVFQRAMLVLRSGGASRMFDFASYRQERANNVECADDQNTRELPDSCTEFAETPADLFRKLDEWGNEAIVIPHGTSWGLYTPPASTWDKQLSATQDDPDRQTLLEVFSGHGNSEEYRDWRAVALDEKGKPYCPEASDRYLPTCQRAGQIIAQRCHDAGLPDDECERRAAEARQLAADAGGQAFLTVPGATVDDWLDSGQCRDCFLPPMNHRPGGSAQYITALGGFDEPGPPRRFRMGFIASSDNHSARPGTGYKEFARTAMSESGNGAMGFLATKPGPAEPRAKPFDQKNTRLAGFQLVELERQGSFFLTGGLVAVHGSGRSRDAIWEALRRKEVYATSGPRILLWFDMLRPGGDELPMGSALSSKDVPVFRVRAVGSFEQQQGCPEYASSGLSADRLERLCRGECYHPSDRRRLIKRLEIVRIQPQERKDEPIGPLIQDPWRSYGCRPDPTGCSVTFQDLDFPKQRRDTVYYVRAIEAPSLAVNAGELRCDYDERGQCVKVHRCGTAETVGDDCLAKNEERAWSSPIFVDWPR